MRLFGIVGGSGSVEGLFGVFSQVNYPVLNDGQRAGRTGKFTEDVPPTKMTNIAYSKENRKTAMVEYIDIECNVPAVVSDVMAKSSAGLWCIRALV